MSKRFLYVPLLRLSLLSDIRNVIVVFVAALVWDAADVWAADERSPSVRSRLSGRPRTGSAAHAV